MIFVIKAFIMSNRFKLYRQEFMTVSSWFTHVFIPGNIEAIEQHAQEIGDVTLLPPQWMTQGNVPDSISQLRGRLIKGIMDCKDISYNSAVFTLIFTSSTIALLVIPTQVELNPFLYCSGGVLTFGIGSLAYASAKYTLYAARNLYNLTNGTCKKILDDVDLCYRNMIALQNQDSLDLTSLGACG